MILPARSTFLSSAIVLFSSLLLLFLFYVNPLGDRLNQLDFSSVATYAQLLFFVLHFLFFISGVQLYLRRNNVIQLEIGSKNLKYMPVDVTPTISRRYSIEVLSMYFRKKLISLDYAEIKTIEIYKSGWKGDFIIFKFKSGKILYLPFLANDLNHFDAVYNFIQNRFQKLKSDIS